MIINQHKTKDGRLILSVCDSELIGKLFEENGLQLDLRSDFYRGKEHDEGKLCILAKKAHTIIFTGKDAVEFGLKHDLITKKNIRSICNVPYAQTIIEC